VAGFTKYERELRARLENSDLWPAFEQDIFLDRLDRAVDRALSKRTVEGNLAAILIVHQLTEEMMRLLVRDSQFLTQVALSPWRPNFPTRDRATFGHIEQSLRDSVDFPFKARFLSAAEEMNRLRVAVVHKLTQRGSFAGLRRDALKARRLHEKLYRLFDAAHDDFRVAFSAFRKERL
jgi:hypothetical protein